jgi:hypothetical protein
LYGYCGSGPVGWSDPNGLWGQPGYLGGDVYNDSSDPIIIIGEQDGMFAPSESLILWPGQKDPDGFDADQAIIPQGKGKRAKTIGINKTWYRYPCFGGGFLIVEDSGVRSAEGTFSELSPDSMESEWADVTLRRKRPRFSGGKRMRNPRPRNPYVPPLGPSPHPSSRFLE